MIQRLTHTHAFGEPIEHQNLTFQTLDGTKYQLTHYETEDSRLVWLHGYREENRVRFYTSRTPDEVASHSLRGLR